MKISHKIILKSLDYVLIIMCFYIFYKYFNKNLELYYLDEYIEQTFPILAFPLIILFKLIITLIDKFSRKVICLEKSNTNFSIIQKITIPSIPIAKIQEDWNYNRLLLSNFDSNQANNNVVDIISNQELVCSMQLRVNKLPLFNAFNILNSQYISFTKEIIKFLKLKHLPKNFLIKKPHSSLNDIIFIERGSIGVYLKVESTNLNIFIVKDIYSDTNNFLKIVSMKVDSPDCLLFYIKSNKLFEIVDYVNDSYLKNHKDVLLGLKESSKDKEFKERTENIIDSALIDKDNIYNTVDLNSKIIHGIIKKKHNNCHTKHKKKSKKLSRSHLINIRYYFKEDFHNTLNFFHNNIEQDTGLAGINIIHLNNYNGTNKNNMVITKASNYEILKSY